MFDNQESFCTKRWSEDIATILNSKIGIPQDRLRAVYKSFRNHDLSENHEVEFSQLEYARRDKWRPKGQIHSLQIDLPVWYEMGVEKTVMVIALDPLNDEQERKTYVRLNSPFSLHKEHIAEYYQLIDAVLTRSYNVYVTDIYKLFYRWTDEKKKPFQTVSNRDKDFTKCDIHMDTLKHEIETVNPSMILGLGNEVFRGLLRTDKTMAKKRNITEKLQQYSWNGRKTYLIPHPSPSARGGAKSFIQSNGGSYSVEDYGKRAVDIVMNLNKQKEG